MHVLCIMFFRGLKHLDAWIFVCGGGVGDVPIEIQSENHVADYDDTHTHTQTYTQQNNTPKRSPTPPVTHMPFQEYGIWMDNIRRGIFRPVFFFSSPPSKCASYPKALYAKRHERSRIG